MTIIVTLYYKFQTPVLGQKLQYSTNLFADASLSSSPVGTLFQDESDWGSSDHGLTQAVNVSSAVSIPNYTLYYQYVYFGKNNGPDKNIGDMTFPVEAICVQYCGMGTQPIVEISHLRDGVRSIQVKHR